MPALQFPRLLLKTVFFSNLSQDFAPHGLEVSLQQFSLGLVRSPGVVRTVALVGSPVFLVLGVLPEGLVIKNGSGLRVVQAVRQLYDGEFLFLAYIQLVDELIVHFNKLFLKDGDLLLVLAAFSPIRPLGSQHVS